jgi:hypothetical protein
MPDKKQVKAKGFTKKREGSQSSDLSEIEWSDEAGDFPKKGSSSRNPTNQDKSDASSKTNSNAQEEGLKSKKAGSSPAKTPKNENSMLRKRTKLE